MFHVSYFCGCFNPQKIFTNRFIANYGTKISACDIFWIYSIITYLSSLITESVVLVSRAEMFHLRKRWVHSNFYNHAKHNLQNLYHYRTVMGCDIHMVFCYCILKNSQLHPRNNIYRPLSTKKSAILILLMDNRQMTLTLVVRSHSTTGMCTNGMCLS